MSSWIVIAILSVASYFFGNMNFALIISKLKNKDIRTMGSGNPGTLNMSRNFGLMTGLLTFFLDILKGALPTLLGWLLYKDIYVVDISGVSIQFSNLTMYLFGLCAVLGHIYPILLKFKGGKGIASTIGLFLVSELVAGWPWGLVIFMSLIAALIFIYLTEFGAMGSFIAITPPAICSAIRLHLKYSLPQQIIVYEIVIDMLILVICFITWFAHRKNIERMLAGDEHPTSIKEMLVKLKNKRKLKKAGIEIEPKEEIKLEGDKFDIKIK